MKRSELRETIFKLLFMAQFNSTEEMPEQVRLYFDSLESGREEFPCSKAPTEADEAYMQEKYSRVAEMLPEIDGLLNATAGLENQPDEQGGSDHPAAGGLRDSLRR